VKVGIIKGVTSTKHCELCGGNTSTGCLAPENQGGSLSACPISGNPALGGR